MGGGRIPGPIRDEAPHQDPFDQRGFTDAIPLGGGASAPASSRSPAGRGRSRGATSAERELAPGRRRRSRADQPARRSSPTRSTSIARTGASTSRTTRSTSRSTAARTWVVTAQKSSALLAHEQGHYDITGLTGAGHGGADWRGACRVAEGAGRAGQGDHRADAGARDEADEALRRRRAQRHRPTERTAPIRRSGKRTSPPARARARG